MMEDLKRLLWLIEYDGEYGELWGEKLAEAKEIVHRLIRRLNIRE